MHFLKIFGKQKLWSDKVFHTIVKHFGEGRRTTFMILHIDNYF